MAHYVVSSNLTTTVDGATALTTTGGDNVIVLGGVNVASGGGIGIGPTFGTLDIAGRVIGRDYGIYFSSGLPNIIVEQGGAVSGGSTGIYSSGAAYFSYLVNAGSISGLSGISLVGGANQIVNSGLITGLTGIRLSATAASSSDKIVNSGLITGNTAIECADNIDTITNTGTITGLVFLYGGDDTLDTGAGVLTGIIDMGSGNDTFLGSRYSDVVLGSDGNDLLKGFDGDDTLNGGTGNDQLYGGDGDDRLTGAAGGDILSGGDGADTFIYLGVEDSAPGANDLITDFETGVDKVDISALGAGGAVAINLGLSNSTVYFQTAGAVGGQGVISLYGTIGANDIVVGGATAFFITGTRLADTIVGTSGVDYITGGGGADTLTGGAGNDVFVYGLVADSPSGANDVILDFETGADKLDFTALGAGSAIAINMGPWSTVYYQTATSGSQGVIGISGIVRGSDLNVFAGATVYITGTAGADVIYGSNVADYISGGAGDDNIAGGLGADVLTGGAGSDAFYFFSVADSLVSAPDRITDFDPSADYIDLSSIDANTGAAGQQHFTLVRNFTATAGQLVSYVSGGFIHFDGDVNGDGVADFAVLVTPTAYWDPYADPSHLRL